MPIGFIIRSDEAAVVSRVFEGRTEEGAPSIQNNLFEFVPKYGLRIMTAIQNAELGEDDRRATERLVSMIGQYLASHHRDVIFEPPLPAEPEQPDMFDQFDQFDQTEDDEGE